MTARSFHTGVVLASAALVVGLPAEVRSAVDLPGGGTITRVDFERHVMGLLSRAGCNAGACHGSFQGKNGFRLSLFGADPAHDYAALTRGALGRRALPLDPDRSLLLLKSTGKTLHGGGPRFGVDSWQYQLLRKWIASGATWTEGSGKVVELTLAPKEYATIQPGQSGQVSARARFADGSEEDVTYLCDFRTQDDAVAEVKGPGVVRAGRPGDTALLVSYRGNVRSLRVLVPTPLAAEFRYPRVTENNFIDRDVFAKLRQLAVVPSELSSDAEFLRRVTLDTIGSLPSPEEVRAFLADRSPDKRTKKIDLLLQHPLHAALWATRLSDVTGNNTYELRAPRGAAQAKYSQMWHDWLRKRVAENVPYDQIVKGVLTATSRDGRSRTDWVKEVEATEAAIPKGFFASYADKESLDLFWKIGQAPTLEQFAERTAASFLGVRLECAQCHKHPFDRWTQADYRSFANIFGQVVIGVAPDTNAALTGGKGKVTKVVLPKNAGIGTEVYIGGKGRELPPPDYVPVVKAVIVAPNGKKRVVTEPPPRLPSQALGGPIIPQEKGKDARETLFAWMRSPDNPYFARSFVNRIWGHYFGVGVVHPVDDFSLANPPSNARLLDALAKEFVRTNYDIRKLERTILLSRVYQLSSTPNETNRLDRNNYSRSYVRPLLAEVVIDAIGDATGIRDDFGPDAPPGKRAIEVGSIRIIDTDLAYALRTFGRPDRALPCDCERGSDPSLSQTLYRLADPAVLDKLSGIVAAKGKGKRPAAAPASKKKGAAAPAPRGTETAGPAPAGRLAKLLDSSKTSQEVVEELFLATLCRFPSKAERDHFAAYITARKLQRDSPTITAEEKKLRVEACTDALWALLNTREFIVNH
jgi:hypothetical protein